MRGVERNITLIFYCVLISVGQCELDQHVAELLNVMFYAGLKSPYKFRGPGNSYEAAVSKLKIRKLNSNGG